MKVSITAKHIKASQLSGQKRSPLELALIELDCFEEIRLTRLESSRYQLEIDGNRVKLPAKVQRALNQFAEVEEMDPISFEMPLENELMFEGEDLLLDSFESIDDGFGFGLGF